MISDHLRRIFHTGTDTLLIPPSSLGILSDWGKFVHWSWSHIFESENDAVIQLVYLAISIFITRALNSLFLDRVLDISNFKNEVY